MESLNLNVRVDANNKKGFGQFEVRTDTFDKMIYDKLKEAEQEMSNTTNRYSKEEVLESMNNIIYYISHN